MRNQSARIVLAACLAAASAAAQNLNPAPTPEYQPGSYQGDARIADDASTRWAARQDPQAENYDGPYGLQYVFSKYHADFMLRREAYDPQIELRARYLPDSEIKDEPGRFEMLGYDVDFETPAIIYPDAYLLFGAYYQGRSYTFSKSFGTRGNLVGMPDEKLSAVGVRLGFGVFLDDNVLFEAETNPGLYSDLDQAPIHKDYDFPSSALLTIRAMPSFFFKVGARYSQIYHDAPWLPYLGFSWEIVEGLRFDVLAPEKLELSYWPNASTGISFGAEVTGAEYHVRTSKATGSQEADLHVQEVVAYLGLTTRFNEYLSMRGRVGVTLAGDYDLSSGAAAFDRVEGALSQGLYADFTMGFDF